MKTIGRFYFPDPELPDRERQKEFTEWEPTMLVRGLSTFVVAVARTRCEGAWACYIVDFPEPCNSHNRGAEMYWRTEGVKVMDETLARALFPQMEGVPISL